MGENALILIVEDDDDIRLTLRDYLKKKGHEVLVASDGVGAIKQLLDHDIALVITDYRMELLGGEYWIRFLKTYCPEKKILITSGFLRPDFKIPFEIISKPFDYADIGARVARLLSED